MMAGGRGDDEDVDNDDGTRGSSSFKESVIITTSQKKVSFQPHKKYSNQK